MKLRIFVISLLLPLGVQAQTQEAISKAQNFMAKKKACQLAVGFANTKECPLCTLTQAMCVDDFTEHSGTIDEISGCGLKIYDMKIDDYKSPHPSGWGAYVSDPIVKGVKCSQGGFEKLLPQKIMCRGGTVRGCLETSMMGGFKPVLLYASEKKYQDWFEKDIQLHVAQEKQLEEQRSKQTKLDEATQKKAELEKQKAKVESQKKAAQLERQRLTELPIQQKKQISSFTWESSCQSLRNGTRWDYYKNFIKIINNEIVSFNIHFLPKSGMANACSTGTPILLIKATYKISFGGNNKLSPELIDRDLVLEKTEITPMAEDVVKQLVGETGSKDWKVGVAKSQNDPKKGQLRKSIFRIFTRNEIEAMKNGGSDPKLINQDKIIESCEGDDITDLCLLVGKSTDGAERESELSVQSPLYPISGDVPKTLVALIQ